jgi:glycosyltransferase involved in cell wall biosynthesis
MISIIITTKDRKKFLLRAVKSIFESDLLPNELIIVNDGGELIEETIFDIFNKDTIKLTIINNITSLGGNKARNMGVSSSIGTYLFFLDDDDAFTPTNISSKLNVFNKNPSAGLVYTGSRIVFSNDLQNNIRTSKPYQSRINTNVLLEYGNMVGSTSCVAMKRDVFIAAGGFDENLVALQDYDLWIRVSNYTELVSDEETNLIYTIHSNKKQISGNYDKYLAAGEYLLNKYEKKFVSNKQRNKFISKRYLRVAMSSSHSSLYISSKFSILSFLKSPNIKALYTLVPYFLQKRIRILS